MEIPIDEINERLNNETLHNMSKSLDIEDIDNDV